MDASSTIADVRARSGLSLRALAARCATSHATLSAYEAGRIVPGVKTLERIVRGAGFELAPVITRSVGDGDADRDPSARGRELVDALELAAEFPARHLKTIAFPPFRSVAHSA